MLLPTLLGVIFIVLLIWIICMAYLYHNQISTMIGMVLSMTLGMMVGLSIGTLLAIVFPNLFFEVTVISILIGGIVGVVTGLPFSLIAVIDGLVSGLMGGMMGTMLGVMISPANHNQLLNIMSLWTVGIFFFVYLLLISEVRKGKIKNNFIFKPLSYFILISIFIFGFNQYSIKVNGNFHDHSAHANSKEISIIANEYQFNPEPIKILSNEKVTLTLINEGIEEHDFDIKDLDLHLHALPQSKDKLSVTFTEPGTYYAICTIPGHKEAGMTATFIVN